MFILLFMITYLSYPTLILNQFYLIIQIFTKSFVVSQKSKEVSWMKKVSSDTGLEIDEDLQQDLGISDKKSAAAIEDKKIEAAVKRARLELKALLNVPVTSDSNGFGDSGQGYRKKSFVVVAK